MLKIIIKELYFRVIYIKNELKIFWQLLGNKKLVDKDIVIIKLDGIGDFVIWSGYAKELREHYTDRKLTLVCTKTVATIANSFGFFDEVITYEEFINNCNMRKFIKANMLLQPTYSRNFKTELINKMIYAGEKIAIDGDTTNIYSRWVLNKYRMKYSKLVSGPRQAVSEFERYAIFNADLLNKTKQLVLEQINIKDNVLELKEKYYVINLGAGDSVRRWQVARFAKVAAYIYNKASYKIVLIGSEAERVLSDEFKKIYSNKNVIDKVGKTSLFETFGIISNAQFVICNDTSTVHIAAKCGTKAICIAPSYNYPRFWPYPVELGKENLPVFFSECSGCRGCLNPDNLTKMKKECIEAIKVNKNYECIDNVNTDCIIEYLDKEILY